MEWLYILDGHTPVPEPDPKNWAEWFETADRKVGSTKVLKLSGGHVHHYCRVSTVFLGLNSGGYLPPRLFETMVFGGDDDGDQLTSETWEDAEEVHKAVCDWVVKGEQNV